MKIIAAIPARLGSTRLPGKMLRPLGGLPLIVRTYKAVQATGLFDAVFVVCDHAEIFQAIENAGGKAIMSQGVYSCGTDRIASVATQLGACDLVVNVQGDEPFTRKESLADLLKVFSLPENKYVQVASLMHIIKEQETILDPNQVKVVVDKYGDALLFSRAPIPYPRDVDAQPIYYKHIGIYAFRPETLKWFSEQPQSPLEKIEKLENLRLLENGIKIRMVLTPFAPIGIDTESDFFKAEQLIKAGVV